MSETRVGPGVLGQQSVAFPSFLEWGSGGSGEGSPVRRSLKKAAKGVGAELRTHAAPCTRPPPARRGAVPGCTARKRCASGKGAHTRPRRPAARSALGRRSAAPRHRRAARPAPTRPRPPGGGGRPRAPADSRRALRRGMMLNARPDGRALNLAIKP